MDEKDAKIINNLKSLEFGISLVIFDFLFSDAIIYYHP
jgi:hypothetical protein